jgi:hypothetical protein
LGADFIFKILIQEGFEWLSQLVGSVGWSCKMREKHFEIFSAFFWDSSQQTPLKSQQISNQLAIFPQCRSTPLNSKQGHGTAFAPSSTSALFMDLLNFEPKLNCFFPWNSRFFTLFIWTTHNQRPYPWTNQIKNCLSNSAYI